MMQTALNLASLPDDILLSISSFLSLADVLTFPLVCHAFNSVAQNRVLWIILLNAESLVRPIACPAFTDLSTLALEDLRRIACHTIRLQHNWTTGRFDPLPIAGPIKTVILNVPRQEEDLEQNVGLLDLIFQVPGTEYYVFHSRDTGQLLVWDVGLGRQVAPGIFVAKRIVDVSAGRQTQGLFWMGLLVSEHSAIPSDKMMIVRLDYDAPTGPDLKITFEYTFAPNLTHWAIFMTEEYIGAIELSESQLVDAHLRIVAVNIGTGRQTIITTNVPIDEAHNMGAHSGTCTVEDNTFILFEDSDNSFVFLIPKAILPHDANHDIPASSNLACYTRTSNVSWDPGAGRTFTPEGVLSANNMYGVPAVSLQALDTVVWSSSYEVPESVMQIRFWTPCMQTLPPERSTAMTTAAPAAGAPTTIPTLECKWVANIQGSLGDASNSAWKLMLLSHSGCNVLLVMERGTHLELRLIVVDPELNKCVQHRLAVPENMELGYVYGLSIDDHRGVITLLDTRGLLYAIPYA
ncbi:hypothetical protein BDN70DRAFT_822871 [Pholiota conissans]|uniref:F-box domain-containing protein n=1 Tax=Pholiota conissans TaxID=109636 RepID=A0A9P5ZHN4_9AGAR|nr:hypothetical protein BDN70DRAFT_822871 [Pholiota conissans]